MEKKVHQVLPDQKVKEVFLVCLVLPDRMVWMAEMDYPVREVIMDRKEKRERLGSAYLAHQDLQG